MTRTSALWIAIGASLAAIAVVAARTGAPRGPVLVFGAGGKALEQTSDDEDRAMALAVASIDPAERARILERMRYTTARLEARLSPLGSDFGEDDVDPADEFRRSMTAYMPTFTAARALERQEWTSADLRVRIAPSCAEARVQPGETCAPLWPEAEEARDDASRARFLAWAASRAAPLKFASPDAAGTCAGALRVRVTTPESTIALVLTDADLALRPVPERAELQEAARLLGRAMAANHLEDKQHLEAFARGAPSGRVAPWLALGPTALLVVPRLSALALLADFHAEIDARCAAISEASWREDRRR